MSIATLTAIVATMIISQIALPNQTANGPKPPVASSAETEQTKQAQIVPEKSARDRIIDISIALEKGRTAGSMPEGLVVRIGACLGEVDENAAADAKELVELWEFTPNRVHRIKQRSEGGKPIYERMESRECDTKDLCKQLLDGRAIEIQSRKGTGPEIVLAGSIYHRGSRSIEVELNGQTILDLHETNGPFLDAYRETDARAFGKLYERMAEQARSKFDSKSAK